MCGCVAVKGQHHLSSCLTCNLLYMMMAIVMTMIVIVIIVLNISNLPFLAPARKERNFRRVAPEIKIALALWHFQRITAKFVVSRCAYCKLRRDFGFFCFVNHLSEGGVNANHNVTCSPNDSRLLKNSEGNRVGEWIFCRREGGRCCFILASDNNKKDQKNLRSKL